MDCKGVALIIFFILVGFNGFGQRIVTGEQNPIEPFDNVFPQRLFSDAHVTSALLWIKKGVPAHYHAAHSEHVMVLKGKGIMQLGDAEFEIEKGDFIFIPQGTIHSVIVKSRTLKVISIQAPEFDGKDRISGDD